MKMTSPSHSCVCSYRFVLVSVFFWMMAAGGSNALTKYEHGNPTAEEQLILEWVNRGRANPAAEAARFGITLNQGLPAGTISAEPKQPLVFNSKIQTAAKEHAQWMLSSGNFSHEDANGKYEIDRIEDAGYPLLGGVVGENLAHFASNVAGQANVENALATSYKSLVLSPWHRENMFYWEFREAGVAATYNKNPGSIDLYIAQNFGITEAEPLHGSFITGVVYDDKDGDGEYDAGEGLSGVTVTPSTGAHYAVTSSSGGYAVPSSNTLGPVILTLQGNRFNRFEIPTAVEYQTNVKVDATLQQLPAPTVVTGAIQLNPGVSMKVDFKTHGRPVSSFALEVSPDLKSWTVDHSAQLSDLGSGSYRFISTAFAGDSVCYFRVAVEE